MGIKHWTGRYTFQKNLIRPIGPREKLTKWPKVYWRGRSVTHITYKTRVSITDMYFRNYSIGPTDLFKVFLRIFIHYKKSLNVIRKPLGVDYMYNRWKGMFFRYQNLRVPTLKIPLFFVLYLEKFLWTKIETYEFVCFQRGPFYRRTLLARFIPSLIRTGFHPVWITVWHFYVGLVLK